jgi:hypothetical protein
MKVSTKELVNHEKKRKKMESLEKELNSLGETTKRRKMEHSLASATTKFEKSTNKMAADLVEPKRQDPSLVTRDEWLSGHMMLSKHLFYPPVDVKKTWRGFIMTDGISCSWSRRTETTPTTKRKKVPHPLLFPCPS